MRIGEAPAESNNLLQLKARTINMKIIEQIMDEDDNLLCFQSVTAQAIQSNEMRPYARLHIPKLY